MKNHSITSCTEVVMAKDCSNSETEPSFNYVYRYKYNNPLTYTIAVDSYNMLMIAISAISLSRRGLRKLPQGADVLFANHVTNVINDNHGTSFYDFCSAVNNSKDSNRL